MGCDESQRLTAVEESNNIHQQQCEILTVHTIISLTCTEPLSSFLSFFCLLSSQQPDNKAAIAQLLSSLLRCSQQTRFHLPRLHFSSLLIKLPCQTAVIPRSPSSPLNSFSTTNKLFNCIFCTPKIDGVINLCYHTEYRATLFISNL